MSSGWSGDSVSSLRFLPLGIVLILAFIFIPITFSDSARFYDGIYASRERDVSFSDEVKGDGNGRSLSFVDDVNGDDIDDFIIGAPYNDQGGIDSGKVYLFFGGYDRWNKTESVSCANVTFIGDTQGGRLGFHVSGIGDVNGDGLGDIALCSYQNRDNDRFGVVSIFFGRTVWHNNYSLSSAEASYIIVGDDYFVANGKGDFNDDGFDDISINNLRDQYYLIYGRSEKWSQHNLVEISADIRINFTDTSFHYSFTSIVPDVNGDGSDDMVICQDKVYFFFGGSHGDRDLNQTDCNASYISDIKGESLSMVTYLGDINGDNLHDILVSSAIVNSNHAKHYIIFGNNDCWGLNLSLSNTNVWLEGPSYVHAACGGGDFNCDNLDDFAILGYDETGREGSVYIFLGKEYGWGPKTPLDSSSYKFLYDTNNNFYYCCRMNGDIDNDGYSDLIMGRNHGSFEPNVHYYTDLFLFEEYFNKPPILYVYEMPDGTEDQKYYFDKCFGYNSDPTEDVLSWNMTTDIGSFRINQNGSIEGIPRNSDVGPRFINITLWDNWGAHSWNNQTIMIHNTNDSPVIISEKFEINEDESFSIKMEAYDEDPTNDVLTWSIDNKADWFALDNSTGILSGIPSQEDVGSYWFRANVSDGNGGMDSKTLELIVHDVNDPPRILTDPVMYILEDHEYVQTFEFYDIDTPLGDLKPTIRTNARFLDGSKSSSKIAGIPSNDDLGIYWINLTVEDDRGGMDSLNYTLTVLNENDPPMIITKDILTATENIEYHVGYKAVDPDPSGETLIWSCITNASFLTMDETSGVLSGIPINDDVGPWQVEIAVTDGSNRDFHEFTLTVVNVNDPPEFIGDDLVITLAEDAQDLRSMDGLFTDIDSKDLSLYFEPVENITLFLHGITLGVIPKQDWSGQETIIINCSDGEAITSGQILIEVTPMNDPPTELSVSFNASYEEGSPQIVNVTANDPDLPYGDVLNFTWYADGKVIGFGSEIDLGLKKGEHRISVTATDLAGEEIHQEFAIRVESEERGSTINPVVISASVLILGAVIGFIIFLVRSKMAWDIHMLNKKEQ